jgi:serine O-acetyltransferase
VTIYANAIILGGDTVIGRGAVIGGGVFITSSVPSGATVTFTPPELRIRDRSLRPKAPAAAPAPQSRPDFHI